MKQASKERQWQSRHMYTKGLTRRSLSYSYHNHDGYTHTTRTCTHKTDAAANNGGDGGTQDKYRRELDSHWNQSFSSLEEQQKIKMISKLIIILFCFKMIFSPLSLFYSLFLMCFVVVDVCVCNLLFLVLSSSPTFLLEDRFAHELDNVFVLDFLVGLDLWQREG